jgi:23S rRNA pseudouridine2605 synthase
MPGQPSTPPSPSDSPRHTLVKYLVAAGLGSRRHCASLILSGYVRVNGEIAESLIMDVSHRDTIDVDGREVAATRTGHVYLLANKPDGHLSSVTDDRGRPTIIQLVPRALRMHGLVPAGRLDLHSTGLILLTTDGELVNRVTHPRYEIEKEYHVLLDRVVTPTASSKLKTGVEIETGQARAMALRRLHDESGFKYSITLNEGRKREVRLMFRAVSRQVLGLERVRIGNLMVDGLEVGEVREMTDKELADLRRLVGMVKAAPKSQSAPSMPQQSQQHAPARRSPQRQQRSRSGQQSEHPGASRPGGPPRRNNGPPSSGPPRTDNRGRSR